MSEVVDSIHRKKLQKLRPFRPEHDPYIVAVLIALAQEQRVRLQERPAELKVCWIHSRRPRENQS